MTTYRPGDAVVFRKWKRSPNPGPRARSVQPSQQGDDYSYSVDKYWVVEDLRGEQVHVRTRRGKTHVMDVTDQRLRPARWWERWLLRDRFPQIEAVAR